MQPGATLIFLDANILYSRTLRDWFALISLNSGAEGIALRWSEDVMTEFIYHLRRKNPGASDHNVGLWREKLTSAFPNAMISGYEISPEFLQGRDQFDAHVLAAATHGRVDYLVTANPGDFEEFADRLEFEIFRPDDMLCLMIERRPDAVLAATKKQCQYWAGRPDSKSLPAALIDAGTPDFARHIQAQLATLALSGRY